MCRNHQCSRTDQPQLQKTRDSLRTIGAFMVYLCLPMFTYTFTCHDVQSIPQHYAKNRCQLGKQKNLCRKVLSRFTHQHQDHQVLNQKIQSKIHVKHNSVGYSIDFNPRVTFLVRSQHSGSPFFFRPKAGPYSVDWTFSACRIAKAP